MAPLPSGRVLVDLDNIEFYRSQPSKQLQPEAPAAKSDIDNQPPAPDSFVNVNSHDAHISSGGDTQPSTSQKDPGIGDRIHSDAGFRHDVHRETSPCGTPSRFTPQNDVTPVTARDQGYESDQGDVGRSYTFNDRLGGRLWPFEQEDLGSDRHMMSLAAPSQLAQLTTSCERQPTVAAVVPPPPRRKAFAVAQARISTSGSQQPRRYDDSQDENNAQHNSQPGMSESGECQHRSKRRRIVTQSVKEASDHALSGQSPKSPTSSKPMSTSLSSAGCCKTRDIFGRAILTVESHGSEESYFFSFIPTAPNQINTPSLQSASHETLGRTVGLSHAPPASNSRKSVGRRPYSSAEEALLVKLKENKNMDWEEIAHHFPGRSVGGTLFYESQAQRC
ncbi:SANT/Myb-like DNA-binding domain-containing protein [Aspergillus tanneri]|uniref:Myb-like domain-containing protein n=1 Tax=Aspergillus tanneri TaxID=1220188 RepID=A0A5M9N033_9EURO|nr:uncharacterized protein ATNIH1004_001656 [Aspergillus tanneri]KAA8652751.1 hypothetical protein ATNIH1004_001656 [Aspergillus tanneri]